MATERDFTITSLRGGMNNTDPKIALPDDQCILAENVEFVDSMLGERRLGTDAIDLPVSITAHDKVPFLFRHLPSSDETAAELHVLGVTGTSSATLSRKTTSWTDITVIDTPLLTGFAPYRWQAASLHGKMHLAFDSSVNRLHVIEGTTMRRSGLAEPAAPTAADSGGVGTLAGTRYGRVRYAVLSGSTVLRRSEPSDVLTFAPSGANASITWTKPASISESETHWELELSTDNSTFYMYSRQAVAVTTYVDSVAYGTGYSAGTESEDIEDYALIPSARYLVADEDRLIWAGSYEDAALASRVGWTPVYNASGVGNDERFETDTTPYRDLDTYENGPVTGLSQTSLGNIWVFKQHAIYKLTRTNARNKAYQAAKYTEAMGAIHGSVVSGVDEGGQPCVYFIDHEVGPSRIGVGGIKRCGEDIRKTWELLSVDATAVVCSSLYYPKKQQVIWNIAISGGNTPTRSIVLHVDKARTFAEGVRKGWSLWTGNRSKALAMCLFSDNVDANAARSNTLVPFIGLEGLGLVHRCETGYQDNSIAYAATITTKPYVLRSLLQQFRVRIAALLAKATASSQIVVKCIKNFDATAETTYTSADISLAATATETDVIKFLDDFKGAEMHTAQITFTDVAAPTAQWQLNQFVMSEEEGLRK